MNLSTRVLLAAPIGAAFLLALVSASPSATSPAPTASPAPSSASTLGPVIADTRTYRIRQTVTLRDVPSAARSVRVWVPIPSDGAWQHVLDRRVVDAPEGWKLERALGAEADTIVATVERASDMPASVSVVVETTVQRQSPRFDLASAGGADLRLFANELRKDAPLMSVDEDVAARAAKACAGETDPARKVVRLLDMVADAADHYSKDPTKPNCGRGSAQDCLARGGGCCTDLHSLFVAAARSQGIPARIQFGYRLNPAKAGTDYDPSYRCWVEYYLAGSGWVPTDVVVADAGERDARAANYGTLDARRVWLWQGRSLELVPRQSGAPIETMTCGWAEIDGRPVEVLPAADGSPSKLTRSIRFEDLTPAAK